ncbi:MAG: hypothetical protein MR740_02250 [Clostridium sp.]|nr:hypothetical protein [Clostridium sp.]
MALLSAIVVQQPVFFAAQAFSLIECYTQESVFKQVFQKGDGARYILMISVEMIRKLTTAGKEEHDHAILKDFESDMISCVDNNEVGGVCRPHVLLGKAVGKGISRIWPDSLKQNSRCFEEHFSTAFFP